MVDFEITDTGDLIVKPQPTLPPFRLCFRVSKHPGFTLRFFQAQKTRIVNDSVFQLRFETLRYGAADACRLEVISGMTATIQQVKIRLRTELSQLPLRTEVGSRLQTMKHKRLGSAANLAEIEKITLEAIEGIVARPRVVAKAEKSDGPFYCQNTNVYIFSEDALLYQFSL